MTAFLGKTVSIYWHSRCSIIGVEANQRYDREEVRTMEMAWGMIMVGFTLFGMIALVVMSITMADEQQPDSAVRHTDESAVTTTEIRKAA
jgi:hypothetical protein